ncbi:hypothetical protein Phi39:1_gp48 [Cellulophaga phage phi39:1]|uniref:hypothetical protein n=1 Tax=Cellulophaga phage phi39:1 TaxID=1327993 RepID=UPI0003517E67|nr:hypothetical protein Phi39:1_gp48 [Cellulophaga phage phi39:1]AGO49163.1 hypothetical protein Phi39:1_gp48 [Cellulophaga phage phi39:1]
MEAKKNRGLSSQFIIDGKHVSTGCIYENDNNQYCIDQIVSYKGKVISHTLVFSKVEDAVDCLDRLDRYSIKDAQYFVDDYGKLFESIKSIESSKLTLKDPVVADGFDRVLKLLVFYRSVLFIFIYHCLLVLIYYTFFK